jgi:N-acetylmuramic acid 6-phosphate (MurNAc-6-P) etherase
MHLASVEKTTANEAISNCHGDLRHAIATCWADGDVKLAARRLTASGGHLGPLEREFGVSEPQN